jgi:MerR family transcriptional regulator, copper efflux regulator
VTTYRVSELAEQAGLPPSTVRFYERAGLVPARRSPSGYRLFDDRAVERIELITTGKKLGLPLEEIRELLAVWQDGLCRDVRARLRPMVLGQIADAERRAAEIDAFIERLRQASLAFDGPVPAGRCDSLCCGLPGQEAVPATGGLSPRPDAPSEPSPEPPAVCTLAAAMRPGRLGEWQRLLGQAHGRSAIDGGMAFLLAPALAGQAAELAAAELECCAFFQFTLHLAGDELRFELRAPEDAWPALAPMFGGSALGASAAG